MSTPHKATEEQWEIVEICRAEGKIPWPTATCLLELRARIDHLERALLALTSTVSSAGHDHRRRIEALEQRPIPPMAEVAAEPAPAIEPPPLDVPQGLAHDWINRHGIFRPVLRLGSDWKERTGTDWGRVITEAARWGQRQGWDARGATTGLAERQAPPPLRCPGAHTIAECGGPCEQDFRLCDCGLLQQLNPKPPASKRLWEAMEEAGRRDLDDNPHAELAEFYEAMIRAVADWLEARGNRGSAAELREEANRA